MNQVWSFGDWRLDIFYGSDNLRQSPGMTLYRIKIDHSKQPLEKGWITYHDILTSYNKEFAPTLNLLFAAKERERNGETPNWPNSTHQDKSNRRGFGGMTVGVHMVEMPPHPELGLLYMAAAYEPEFRASPCLESPQAVAAWWLEKYGEKISTRHWGMSDA